MTTLDATWSQYLDRQHRYPTGWVGRVVGERMVRQHAPETDWSIALLDLGPADHLLEIGCGAGQGLALALNSSSVQYAIGVDLSPTMLRGAARRNRAALVTSRLTLLRGDLAALPLRAQSVSKIVSVHTFYFWPDPRVLFERLVGLLASGGRLVTTFATAKTLSNGVRKYWPLHEQAQALVRELDQMRGVQARFLTGPDSRQFNNVAIVVERR